MSRARLPRLKYILEAALLYGVFGCFKCLPVVWASNVGGFIGRMVGPHLGASKKAMKNLARAFPEKSEQERRRIMVQSWDHMGRVFAEYPHIREIAKNRVHAKNPELVDQYKNSDHGAMFISGHIGNWEVGCATAYLNYGIEIGSAYRAPNNPWAERLLLKARTLNGTLKSFSKSRTGGRDMMKAAQNKENIVFLIDQKYNEGVCAPFFGHDAMTNTGFITIAQKYDMDIVPVRIIREENVQFQLLFYPPIATRHADGSNRDHIDILNDAHRLIESWITEYPEQWLWLHRRWKD